MITITIETENDAFDPMLHGAKANEVSRILRELAEDIEKRDDCNHVLRDINGNCVGWCKDDET